MTSSVVRVRPAPLRGTAVLLCALLCWAPLSLHAQPPAGQTAAPAAKGAPAAKTAAPAAAAEERRGQSDAGVRKLTLKQLLEIAPRQNPGVEAARHQLDAFEAQLFSARLAWIQGNFDALLAPAPEIRCNPSPERCITTDPRVPGLSSIKGVLVRTQVNVAIPLYTWGKLTAARDAAHAGVKIGKQQLRATQLQLAMDVQRAYHAVKLGREVLSTIEEGKGYLTRALKSVEDQLEKGKGAVTVTDVLRLKTFAAEVEARQLEAVRLSKLAKSGLGVLTAIKGDFEVDDRPLEPTQVKLQDLAHYQQVALLHRPEARILVAGEDARRAAEKVAWGKLYPDLALVGFFAYAYSNSADFPVNAFFNNPYNTLTGGVGLALRLELDYGVKVGNLRKARAELRQIRASRRQAEMGIFLDVERAYREVAEAQKRLVVTQRGERSARSWLVAQLQNLAAGLVESKDMTDALLAYFTLRLRALQAIYDLNTAIASLSRAVGARVDVPDEQNP